MESNVNGGDGDRVTVSVDKRKSWQCDFRINYALGKQMLQWRMLLLVNGIRNDAWLCITHCHMKYETLLRYSAILHYLPLLIDDIKAV